MSDALAHGLAVPQALSAPSPFWGQFPNIVARYEPLLSTWRTSTAVKLDGQNYLERDEAAGIEYPITMGTWFKTNQDATTCLLWIGDKGTGARYQALYRDGTKVVVSTRTAAGDSEANNSTYDPDDGSWHFAAAIIEQSNRWVRFDDNDGTANTDSRPISSTYDRTTLARFGDSTPSGYFVGDLQHSFVYLGAMTSAQLDWLYNSGAGRRGEDIPNNPVGLDPLLFSGWWPSDEFSGTRMNWGYGLGGNAIHLNAFANDSTNFPQPTDGVVENLPGVQDRALEFDSSDSQYAEGGDTSVSYPFSLSFWMRAVQPAAVKYPITIGDTTTSYLWLRHDTTGFLRVITKDTDALTVFAPVASSTVSDGSIHLVVVTVSATSRKISIDGGAFAEDTTTINTISTDNIAVGRTAGVASGFYDGIVDEAMLWDSELSATDASELYAAGAGILAQDLISGDETLTSGAKPIHAWPLNSNDNNTGGAGRDIGTIGGITLTLNNSPTDTAGIPAGQSAGNGTVISEWKNLQADNNHVTQATFAFRPRIVAVPDGTEYAVEFDGIADYMQFAGLTDNQPYVIFAVCSIASNNGHICAGGNGARLALNSARYRMSAGVHLTSGASDDGELHIWATIFNGVSSNLYVDGGTASASGNAGTLAIASPFTIGAFAATSAFLDVRLRRLIIDTSLLTDTEINEIGHHLAAQHGLTWTDIT